MNKFNFCSPTHVYFGENSIENLPEAINQVKENAKLLLVYGGGSIKRLGIYDKFLELCKNNGNEVIEMGGVEPNPRVQSVEKGVELVKEHGIDIICGIGGGSAIDAAKAIALARYYEGNAWDIVVKPSLSPKAMPIIAIPTLSATGTETDNFSVISNPETNEKIGIGDNRIRPAIAIMDPTYTYSVNKYHTGAGTADIFSHIFEGYFNVNKGAFVKKRINEALLKTVIKYGPIALEKPDDYEARSNLMWAASLAINGETFLGNHTASWSCHPLEHILSGYYDITHGAGLAVLTPAWMKFCLKEEYAVDDFAEYGVNVWGIDASLDKMEIANIAIEKTKEFLTSLGMPTCLKDTGIPDETKLKEMADHVGNLNIAYVKMTPEDILNIYKSCY